MVDIVDRQTRSRMMSGIKGKDTSGELLIRRALHKKGYRYRLHSKDLPGRPDLVLPKHESVIFVNGCFWHGHQCHLFKWTKTRPEFWKQKITGNMRRDTNNHQLLGELGWRVCIIWECSLKGKTRLSIEDVSSLLSSWINSTKSRLEICGPG